ncbi:hypothetical protein E2C01_061729 [Portunus trituberculatus]|uniref:Uncharacterized protein n=1 Tax=Portunus trituberculatus TaxID=210409 RepID=A0A5B7H8Y1_PORTR|nr:hypothetical protein [Portunus trituberculatus]
MNIVYERFSAPYITFSLPYITDLLCNAPPFAVNRQCDSEIWKSRNKTHCAGGKKTPPRGTEH